MIEEFGKIPVKNEDVTRLRQWLGERDITDITDRESVLEEAISCFGEGYTTEDIKAIVDTLNQRETEASDAADAEAGL